jgi:hypothetical protein
VIEDDDKKFLRVPYLLTGLEAIDIRKIKKQMDPTNQGNDLNKAL